MHHIVQYTISGVILAVIFGIINGYPLCTNLCPSTQHYGYECCSQFSGFSNANLKCPLIENCGDVIQSQYVSCKNNGECLRNQVCCKNPCFNGESQCMNGTLRTVYQTLLCPVISNCSEWHYDVDNAKHQSKCTSDNDCLRSRSCCINPCIGHKTCLLSITQTPKQNWGCAY